MLIAVALAATTVGPAPIPLEVQLRIYLAQLPWLEIEPDWPASYARILLDIRLPRVALAALVGGALAVAGSAYQGLFRNPLADPYLLGIASGAGLGAVIAFVAPLPDALYGIGIVQLMAFATASLTAALVYLFARVGRTTPTSTLLLAGVAIGTLASAASAYLMYINGEKLFVIYAWMLGGFNVSSWRDVLLTAPYVIVGSVLIALYGRVLNVMQLDDEQAAALGIDVERTKLLLVGAATLVTAAAVASSGLIGFVGLIVPHTVRLLFGPDHRRLVPLAALVGAAFLVAADTAARTGVGRSELPVGVITAGCGAPFFLYLLRRQRRTLL